MLASSAGTHDHSIDSTFVECTFGLHRTLPLFNKISFPCFVYQDSSKDKFWSCEYKTALRRIIQRVAIFEKQLKVKVQSEFSFSWDYFLSKTDFYSPSGKNFRRMFRKNSSVISLIRTTYSETIGPYVLSRIMHMSELQISLHVKKCVYSTFVMYRKKQQKTWRQNFEWASRALLNPTPAYFAATQL